MIKQKEPIVMTHKQALAHPDQDEILRMIDAGELVIDFNAPEEIQEELLADLNKPYRELGIPDQIHIYTVDDMYKKTSDEMKLQQEIETEMQKEIEIYTHQDFGQVRTIYTYGEPWFVGIDVAKILGYKNPNEALREHVPKEDIVVGERNATPSVKDSLGREQFPSFINESGVYSLIMSSKLPSAQQFKRWVTAEVLPSIRKHGAYLTKEVALKVSNDPQYLRNLSNAIVRDYLECGVITKLDLQNSEAYQNWLVDRKHQWRQLVNNYNLKDTKAAISIIYRRMEKFGGYKLNKVRENMVADIKHKTSRQLGHPLSYKEDAQAELTTLDCVYLDRELREDFEMATEQLLKEYFHPELQEEHERRYNWQNY